MNIIDNNGKWAVELTRRDIRIFLKGYFFLERSTITDKDIERWSTRYR